MARHQRMPPEEAGYTYAVEPAANNRLLANEEESIYGRLSATLKRQFSANNGGSDFFMASASCAFRLQIMQGKAHEIQAYTGSSYL